MNVLRNRASTHCCSRRNEDRRARTKRAGPVSCERNRHEISISLTADGSSSWTSRPEFSTPTGLGGWDARPDVPFDDAPAAYRWLDEYPLAAVKVALAYGDRSP